MKTVMTGNSLLSNHYMKQSVKNQQGITIFISPLHPEPPSTVPTQQSAARKKARLTIKNARAETDNLLGSIRQTSSISTFN